MTTLQLQGYVFHRNGAWGIERPCGGADVRVFERDVSGGGGGEPAWSGRTDAAGKFDGAANVRGAAVTSLVVRVKQGRYEVELVVQVDDNRRLRGPLVVPWPPSGRPTVVALRCMGSGPEPNRFLAGRAGEARIHLAQSQAQEAAGTRWQIIAVGGGKVHLCMEDAPGVYRYLSGGRDGSVRLVQSKESPGALWTIGETEEGCVYLSCMETAYKSFGFLDGRTGDASVGLAPSIHGNYTGARWRVLRAGEASHRRGTPIFAARSDKALEVAAGSTEEGAPLVQGSFHGGDNQRFAAEPLADKTYRIVAAHSGLVLGIRDGSSAPQAPVVQQEWRGDDAQRFRIERQTDGTCKISAKHSTMALEVQGAQTGDGVGLQQAWWTGKTHQRFRVLEFGVSLAAVHSNKVLDVNGASTAPGARIIQCERHGGDNQVFRFEALDDGTYRLTAAHSGQALDVSGASRALDAGFIQSPWHGGDNQRFWIEPNADGTVRLVARHSALVADVRMSAMDNGAEVNQHTWHHGPNQKFRFR